MNLSAEMLQNFSQSDKGLSVEDDVSALPFNELTVVTVYDFDFWLLGRKIKFGCDGRLGISR